QVATAASDAVCVWDASTGRRRLRLLFSPNNPMRVVFSPDGRRLAAYLFGDAVAVWDARSGRRLSQFGWAPPTRAPWSELDAIVRFSPDGSRVLAADGVSGVAVVADPASG